jgi:glutamate dehydrogenase
MSLQRRLVDSRWLEDPYLERQLFGYFPRGISERFAEAVRGHRLRREIVALELTNDVIDRMGAAFVHRMLRDTGADAATAVAAWCVVIGIADADRIFDAIAESSLPAEAVYDLCIRWEAAAESATRFVVSLGPIESLGERIERWKRPALELADLEAGVMSAETLEEVRRLEQLGLAAGVARSLVAFSSLRTTLEIARIAEERGHDLTDTALAYRRVGALVDFSAIERAIDTVTGDDRWEKRAAEGLREDVSAARRRMTLEVLGRSDGDVGERLTGFAGANQTSLARVRALAEDLRSGRKPSLAALVVVVRELRRLVISAEAATAQ